jgi:hypothetical protein
VPAGTAGLGRTWWDDTGLAAARRRTVTGSRKKTCHAPTAPVGDRIGAPPHRMCDPQDHVGLPFQPPIRGTDDAPLGQSCPPRSPTRPRGRDGARGPGPGMDSRAAAACLPHDHRLHHPTRALPRGRLAALLAKAGLANRKYHATRRTYATWMLEMGADLRWVQEQIAWGTRRLPGLGPPTTGRPETVRLHIGHDAKATPP